MRSLDQVRAGRAYAALAGAGEEQLGLAIKLPVMLRTNGLLATWAFLLSRASEKTGALLETMNDHLRSTVGLEESVAVGSPADVFRAWIGTEKLPGLTGRELRALTDEAIALAGWLKRAAETQTSAREPGEALRA